eukprot:TRINITY_DN4760_c0_g2_i1.p1 TRINITY_DN4760_c0_g2~~TRINITY_DN4760_c0_g2_i1.p1  ORF type:complete len:250 (-),score=10.46 TRINITY_DN4760_c0_g2_i1:40-789(-)
MEFALNRDGTQQYSLTRFPTQVQNRPQGLMSYFSEPASRNRLEFVLSIFKMVGVRLADSDESSSKTTEWGAPKTIMSPPIIENIEDIATGISQTAKLWQVNLSSSEEIRNCQFPQQGGIVQLRFRNELHIARFDHEPYIHPTHANTGESTTLYARIEPSESPSLSASGDVVMRGGHQTFSQIKVVIGPDGVLAKLYLVESQRQESPARNYYPNVQAYGENSESVVDRKRKMACIEDGGDSSHAKYSKYC